MINGVADIMFVLHTPYWFLRDGLKQLIDRLIKLKSLLYFISPACEGYKTLGVIPKSYIYFIRDR